MKHLQHLLEITEAANASKEDALKKIITPKNVESHYDRIIALLASKMTANDIKELALSIEGTATDAQTVDFILKMIHKRLSVEKNVKLQLEGNATGSKALYVRWVTPTKSWSWAQIVIAKGRADTWVVDTSADKTIRRTTKKFPADKSGEALNYALQQLRDLRELAKSGSK